MNPHDDWSDERPQEELSRELKSFESRLSDLRPRDDRLDRERVMFLAGRASVESAPELSRTTTQRSWERRVWPAAFAAMTTVAATLLVLLLNRPANVVPPASGVARTNHATLKKRLIDQHPSAPSNILSVGDAMQRDVSELWSFAPSTLLDENMEASPIFDVRDAVMLTPASWRQLNDEDEPASPPATNSSDALRTRVNQRIQI